MIPVGLLQNSVKIVCGTISERSIRWHGRKRRTIPIVRYLVADQSWHDQGRLLSPSRVKVIGVGEARASLHPTVDPKWETASGNLHIKRVSFTGDDGKRRARA